MNGIGWTKKTIQRVSATRPDSRTLPARALLLMINDDKNSVLPSGLLFRSMLIDVRQLNRD